VGYAIVIGGGWSWFILVATFFILGSGFTFYKYDYKMRLGSAQEKGGARNWPNILANGGVAAVFGIAAFFSGGVALAFPFLGAMTTAASDTVATEVGLASKSQPRLITRLGRTVAPGTSGGVSPLGFVGAVLAPAVIGVLAFLLHVSNRGLLIIPVAMVSGLVGSLADSVLGATIQRKGACAECGRESENSTHCDKPVRVVSGVSFVDNNIVNLLATLVGAATAFLLAVLL
jgi:uncharacterized protein (TIGR00297 family)